MANLNAKEIQAHLEGWHVTQHGPRCVIATKDSMVARFNRETMTFGKGRRAKTVTEWTCRVDGHPGFEGLGGENPAYSLLCKYAANALAQKNRRKEQALQEAKDAAERLNQAFDMCHDMMR